MPTRLRIGQSYATHLAHVHHVLLNCMDFENARSSYYRVGTLKELFQTVEIPKKKLYLIQAIGLYIKLYI